MARNPTALRLAIVSSGLTQREIAAQTGIEKTRLNRIVNGLQCDEPTRAIISAVLGREKSDLWPATADDDEMAAA